MADSLQRGLCMSQHGASEGHVRDKPYLCVGTNVTAWDSVRDALCRLPENCAHVQTSKYVIVSQFK